MNIQNLVAYIKGLTKEELKELANILHKDEETDLGICHKGSPIVQYAGQCPIGYYFDADTNSCILDVG